MGNLDSWQGNCCQRHLRAGGLNIMSSLVLPVNAVRLSLHAETSPRGPLIETFGGGFKTLDFCLVYFFRAKCKYFLCFQHGRITQSFSPSGKSKFCGPKNNALFCWWRRSLRWQLSLRRLRLRHRLSQKKLVLIHFV